MRNSTGTPIGISVNKSSAQKKYQVRDTVFRKGSDLNINLSNSNKIGYKANK